MHTSIGVACKQQLGVPMLNKSYYKFTNETVLGNQVV